MIRKYSLILTITRSSRSFSDSVIGSRWDGIFSYIALVLVVLAIVEVVILLLLYLISLLLVIWSLISDLLLIDEEVGWGDLSISADKDK